MREDCREPSERSAPCVSMLAIELAQNWSQVDILSQFPLLMELVFRIARLREVVLKRSIQHFRHCDPIEPGARDDLRCLVRSGMRHHPLGDFHESLSRPRSALRRMTMVLFLRLSLALIRVDSR